MMTSDHCPACAAPALPGATYCSHCATPLAPKPSEEEEEQEHSEPEKGGKLVWLVVVGSMVLLMVAIAGYQPGRRQAEAVQAVPTSAYVTVTYRLSGTAYSASLTYTNDSGNVEQRGPVIVPSKAESKSQGISVTVKRGTFVYFSAQNQNETGSVECAIEVDGVTVNTGRSEGAYKIVTCSLVVS